MKRNLLLLIPLAGCLLLTAPSCKNDQKEDCATVEWKIRDSLLTVREQQVAQRERALALNAAGERLAEENSYNGAAASPAATTTQPADDMTVTMGGKKLKVVKTSRPKATDKFYAKEAGNYPEASSRLLNEKDVQFISHWGYTVMLNEIYARHGMDFTDAKIREHFDKQSWYRNGRRNVDKSLTPIERANIEFLKNHPK